MGSDLERLHQTAAALEAVRVLLGGPVPISAEQRLQNYRGAVAGLYTQLTANPYNITGNYAVDISLVAGVVLTAYAVFGKYRNPIVDKGPYDAAHWENERPKTLRYNSYMVFEAYQIATCVVGMAATTCLVNGAIKALGDRVVPISLEDSFPVNAITAIAIAKIALTVATTIGSNVIARRLAAKTGHHIPGYCSVFGARLVNLLGGGLIGGTAYLGYYMLTAGAQR